MRKKVRLSLAIALTAVCALIILPKWWASMVEDRLAARVTSELLGELPDLASEDWRVYMDGSSGIVHGTVSSQALYHDAAALIARMLSDGKDRIRGLDGLRCALSVPHSSTLELSIDDETGAIGLAGDVPESAESRITSALASAFPDSRIENRLQSASGRVSDAAWAVPLGEMLPVLMRSVGNLSLSLEGRAIEIQGRVANKAVRNQIQHLLLEGLSGSIDFVRNGLTTLDSDLAQSFLSLEFTEADALVLRGRVGSKITRDRLIRGLEGIAPAGVLIEDRLTVRASAGGVWWSRPTLAFLPEAIGLLKGCEFHVDPRSVRLTGEGRPEEREKIHKLARHHFPPLTYTITSQVKDPPIEETPMLVGNDPPPAVIEIAQLSPDSGDPIIVTKAEPVLPDDEPAATSPVTENLRALVAGTKIFFSSGSTRVRAAEQERLAELAGALADAPGIRLAISGLADPVGNSAANRRLAERRCAAVQGALQELGLDSTRLELVGGGETSPAPGEPSWQLRRVEFSIREQQPAAATTTNIALGGGDGDGDGDWRASVTATRIYFEKNSTQLSFEERSKLERLAELLRNDESGTLGISGFTDPKGKRYYNEQLSELRCQAVHQFLIGQGVPDSRLRTQPGGELTSAPAGEPSWQQRRVQFQWVELAAAR